MPYDKVMHKFKHGELRSGSGGKVTDRKQAIAIMLSEKEAAGKGKQEYKSMKDKKKSKFKKGKKRLSNAESQALALEASDY